MGLVTLLTDYNNKDFYLAKVESRAKRLFPSLNLLHIAHLLPNFKFEQAAFNFNAMLDEFQADDLHFIFLNHHGDSLNKLIIAQTQNEGVVISADNGLLGLLNCEFTNFYQLPIPRGSFPELEILQLVKDYQDDLSQLEIVKPKLFRPVLPVVTDKELKGQVIYVDGYGNCIVNIREDQFKEFTVGNSYHIKMRREIVERIDVDYSNASEAGLSLFFNEQGYLEISMVYGNASKLLGLTINSIISVKKN